MGGFGAEGTDGDSKKIWAFRVYRYTCGTVDGAWQVRHMYDIIKLNKKEQQASRAAFRARSKRAANKNNVLKKLSQAPQLRRGLKRGALQYYGSTRSRGLNRARGLGRRGSLRGSGLSPLNRASAITASDELGQSTVPQRGGFRGRGRGRGRGGLNRGAFSTRGQSAPQRGGRPFTLDRGFAATRGAGKLERYQKIRSQTTASSSGTMLTVSLPNATSPSPAPIRLKRGGAMLRGRSPGAAGSPSPKGIQLHFNYKATTNQTGLSLHDRFTSLRFRGHGPRAERGSGRGRGRGEIRGRGRGEIRGRGRGEIRGRGRGGERGRGRGGRGRGMLRGGVAATQGVRGGRARGGRGAARGEGRMVILQ
ncbi:hypothetical protein NFI96_010839 [Prochilodus magdalenae]|nr:hypothetical protein NFI96_010839 [Prochilodus magdalenae]